MCQKYVKKTRPKKKIISIQHNSDKVVIYNAKLVERLELEEKKIGRKYRKNFFKKIAHLPFSEKKIVLRLVDHKILTEGLALLDTPRRCSFTTHRDRYYLYSCLKFIDGVLDEVKKTEKLQQIQKRRANIKLVWVNKS